MCPCDPSNPSAIQGTHHHHWPHSSHYLCPVYKPSALGAFDGQNLSHQRLLEWDDPAPVWGEGPPSPKVSQEEALPHSFIIDGKHQSLQSDPGPSLGSATYQLFDFQIMEVPFLDCKS